MPDVSIIIPVYNAEKYLEECLSSITAQKDFERSEVVLIDDGSTDRSSEICDSFSAEFKNIIAVHKSNGGVSEARNDGINVASSDYLMFCDADDYFIGDILSSVINTVNELSPDIIFWNYIYEANGSQVHTDFAFAKNQMLDKKYLRRTIPEFMLSNLSFNSIWNKAFKKSIIQANSIKFNKNKKYGEDREFLLNCLAVSESGFYIHDSGYFYRDTVSGAIRKERTDFFDNIIEDYYTNLRCYERFDFDKEKIDSLCRAALPEQVISDIFFIYENYSKSVFNKSVEKLFCSELLMSAVSDYLSAGSFKNENYKSAAKKILSRSSVSLRLFLSSVKAKEALYRMIKG